jgi:alkanesulfonate monooxygenase SsuD/methylene tetrahydromethanopterin reductase-like flavin-dependent oxidoreductase (luciferase family)
MTGAMGPQSLRLTAELADGISVSSSYVPFENLPWFREQLDSGARGFRRDPNELFINFNIMGHIHDATSSARPRNEGVFWGDVDWWTERLQSIKAMGVSRFTYWPVHGDPDDQLRRFIQDVVPNIR